MKWCEIPLISKHSKLMKINIQREQESEDVARIHALIFKTLTDEGVDKFTITSG